MISAPITERWRQSPTLPEYMVSDHGRIMRIPYWKPIVKGGIRSYGGQPWVGAWDGNRYVVMHKRKTYRVARLICEAFHGEPPTGRKNCLHKDENSRNNKASNLSWGSQRENLNAPGFIEYCKSRTGVRNPRIKGRIKKRLAASGNPSLGMGM